MSAPQKTGRRLPRAWPVLLLAAPAFVAIWSGWVGLGGLTGFGMVNPLPGIWDDLTINSAITLPIGVETYAAYALHVWLARGVDARATRFAKYSALGSLVLGAGGQVAYHLMVAAGITEAPWQITAVVACLPVAVLGMGAGLAHLVADSTDPTTEEDTTHAEIDPTATNSAGTGADQPPADAPAAEPVPAPVTRTAPRRTATGPGSVAVKVRRLRDKHPDWTHAQIGEKAGCAERTVRRHLNTTTSTDTPPAPTAGSGMAPASVGADDGQVAA